ncbi:hypothetical protein [Methanocella arvoryzae]|uniref:hypothetical protein n=1 Tax=Methanocella arvoryzae TaxID=1175445 RepID=UPI00130547D2|nr:hypothetical protein [Methanocella arvoryzae]
MMSISDVDQDTCSTVRAHFYLHTISFAPISDRYAGGLSPARFSAIYSSFTR